METMKQYVAAYQPPNGIGWIWSESFDKYWDAGTYVLSHFPDSKWQIIDTFNNDKIIASGD